MIVIRSEQMRAFEENALRGFENRMIPHLQRFAPSHFKVLTEDEIRIVIREGQRRARGHRLSWEYSVRYYIESMFLLGSAFDSDPQYPWAAEILSDTSSNEAERIDRLTAAVWAYINRVLPDYPRAGNNDSIRPFLEELRNLSRLSREPLPASLMPQFSRETADRLNRLFPRKCEYLGDGLYPLIERAVPSAARYQITSVRGVALFVAMSFLFGSGFDDDPLLPWVALNLNDQTLDNPHERVDKLYATALERLRQWWT